MTLNIHPGHHWYPTGARQTFRPPQPGAHLAWDHAAWRVIEVNSVPLDRWTDFDRERVAGYKPEYRDRATPAVVVVRPARLGDDIADRNHDKHLRHRDGVCWYVYPDEHYPVCAACGEPLPCREKVGQSIAEDAFARMARYETAFVCPSCQEPITGRQKAMTFSENLHVLGGPPVTYHVGRRFCRYAAAEYEKKWVAADPQRRRAKLSCPGHVTTHGDGTYECTEFADCPGAIAEHRGYELCRDPECYAGGRFPLHPDVNARRRTGVAS